MIITDANGTSHYVAESSLPNCANVRLARDFLAKASQLMQEGNLEGWASCLRLAATFATDEAHARRHTDVSPMGETAAYSGI